MSHSLSGKKLLVLALVLCGSAAFADGEGAKEAAAASEGRVSEYFYQAEGGHFEITPAVTTTLDAIKYNDTVSGHKNLTAGVATTPIGAEFEYGITNGLAVGINLNYQDSHIGYKCDDTTCPDNTSANGLMDPELYLKGTSAIGGGALHYGGALEVAVEKLKIKSSGSTNAATGGIALTPYVGYDRPLWKGYIGGKVSYQTWLSQRQGTDDTAVFDNTVKINGGDVMRASAFYEVNFNIMTYGVSLNYARTQESHVNGDQQKDAVNESTAEFYFPAHFTPKLTLLPVIGFGGGNFTSSGASKDAEAIFKMGVGCRFIF